VALLFENFVHIHDFFLDLVKKKWDVFHEHSVCFYFTVVPPTGDSQSRVAFGV